MAEIKSTLDLVLERAASMGMASAEEMHGEEARRSGAQLVAAFLDDATKEPKMLTEALKNEAGVQDKKNGMLNTLLRNIFLPRDAAGLNRVQRAMRALLALLNGNAQIMGMCRDLDQICGRYSEHRKQLQKQLRDQLEQALAAMDGKGNGGLSADGEVLGGQQVEERFAQEWLRLEGELNAQYSQTIEQYKRQLAHLAGVAL